ncbi:hypothetical protein, partial [Paraburkholderia sediminicola]|uniref:hypothetical protein n=1 Tax=Paraburkholderia sediminicola TaxID=458836 RepID=UPI0038B70E5D
MSVILGFCCVPLNCSKAYAELKAGAKTSGWFDELRFGARSAAGSMTPLSLAHAGARTQIPDAPLPYANHGA